MADRSAIPTAMDDELVTTYPLRGGAIPLVRIGEQVAAGDTLARGSRPSALVAYADILGLTATEAAADIRRHDGESYHAGTTLGTRRVGLRTRSVSSAVSGALVALPQSGALAIRDEARAVEYRVRHSGVVRAINEGAIVVAADVIRRAYAFADGTPAPARLHIVPDMLAATLTGDPPLPSNTYEACGVVAHVANIAALRAPRSHRHSLLVGAVSEEVAWQLLSRPQAARQHAAKRRAVVVLHGVGDLDAGIAAVAMFGNLDGAFVSFERLSRTVVALPAVGAGARNPSNERSRQDDDLRANH